MDRRRFLVLGAAGTATLAAAGAWTWMRGRRDADTSAQDRAVILAAIVPAMLDGALPAAGLERRAALRETVDNVGRAIAGLPPAARDELGRLFSLLALPVGRRVFAGVEAPWNEATADDVSRFLDAWRRSGWALKRSAYDALHQLIHAAWYGNPRAWSTIGYPGPPRLG
jgi:hypothetical protein